MKLRQPNYGKARVRVMKVSRNPGRHSLKELEISIMLQGSFEAAYTGGDNSLVVPTDTMKNTINVLAKQNLGDVNEEFGVVIAKYFLLAFQQVEEVQVRLSEHCWQPLSVNGRPHPHSFLATGGARPIAEVRAERGQIIVKSGIENLVILKTTQSGFEGFARDKYTTLKETRDRVLATQLQADWTYRLKPRSYSTSNTIICDSILKVFAETYSPSVQRTLFQMGEAALNAVAEISEIHLSLPNKHCLLIDLAPFGLDNQNELFLPTDEPHGQIQGTVTRD